MSPCTCYMHLQRNHAMMTPDQNPAMFNHSSLRTAHVGTPPEPVVATRMPQLPRHAAAPKADTSAQIFQCDRNTTTSIPKDHAPQPMSAHHFFSTLLAPKVPRSLGPLTVMTIGHAAHENATLRARDTHLLRPQAAAARLLTTPMHCNMMLHIAFFADDLVLYTKRACLPPRARTSKKKPLPPRNRHRGGRRATHGMIA